MTEPERLCPNGHPAAATDKFCQTCGAVIFSAVDTGRTCPEGHPVEPDHKFCPTCSAPVASPRVNAPPSEAPGSERRERPLIGPRRAVLVMLALVLVVAIAAAEFAHKIGREARCLALGAERDCPDGGCRRPGSDDGVEFVDWCLSEPRGRVSARL